MSGAALVDGEEHTFIAGQRLSGDSPIVQATAQFWTLDGDEVPTHWDAVVERDEAERGLAEYDVTLTQPPVPLEAEDVLQLDRAITVGIGTGKERQVTTYEKGTCFNARSEFCAAAPDAFAPAALTFTRGRK